MEGLAAGSRGRSVNRPTTHVTKTITGFDLGIQF